MKASKELGDPLIADERRGPLQFEQDDCGDEKMRLATRAGSRHEHSLRAEPRKHTHNCGTQERLPATRAEH